MHATSPAPGTLPVRLPIFGRGDLDGFFGLMLDNLVQLLLIDGLCRGVLGMSSALVHGRILPGVAVSMLVGNVLYARQARSLAEREGRVDVCALPYGINTVSLFAHVFLVMLPAKLAAEAMGAAAPATVAWQAGLVATFGSGVIELAGAPLAGVLRRALPRAALLSTLSGIALGFIAIGFLLRTFAHPLVGLSTLAIVLAVWFGRVRFVGGIPGGLVAVVVGAALAWATGLAPTSARIDTGALGLHLPLPAVDALVSAIATPGVVISALAVIVPMGLFNVMGSLQNIESAEAAGDTYPVERSLAVNGAGTLAACAFGSCFPTTIYIGHPGWKAMGARAGYSVANGVFVTAMCLSGTLAVVAWAVPVDAGMAIILWIGIVITAQAFTATPAAHAPAVVLGILPGVAAWGVLMAKTGVRAAGTAVPGGPPLSQSVIDAFVRADVWIEGGFAIEQGFIFTSLLLAAMTVAVIERQWNRASILAAIAAALSAAGIMHGYVLLPGDAALALGPAWPWVAGYLAMAAVFALIPWTTRPDEGPGH